VDCQDLVKGEFNLVDCQDLVKRERYFGGLSRSGEKGV
jgi:hypothetical protein